MRDLNEIDPLPAFKAPDWQEFLVGYGDLPESERQKKEWRDATKKANGEDWHAMPDSPGIEVNSRGQMRTVDYKPPEPPETDIPIPCVVESMSPKTVFYRGFAEMWAKSLDKVPLDLSTFKIQLYSSEAESQPQAASQMTVDTGFGLFELDRLYSKADADGWIPHTPGDPMPCDPGLWVEVKFRDGSRHDEDTADDWDWEEQAPGFQDAAIVAWRPA